MHNHENISATDKAVINFIKASKDYIAIPKIKQLCKNLKVNDHGRYEISSDNISMYILAHKQIYQTIKIFNSEYILKFDSFNTVKYFFKQFNHNDYALNELIRTKKIIHSITTKQPLNRMAIHIIFSSYSITDLTTIL